MKSYALSKSLAIVVAVIVVVAGLAGAAVFLLNPTMGPQSEKPLRIGFSMPLTGGLAVNGKAGLIAIQIWAEDVNARGGILGRPVELVYYDDKSDPSAVPGIYEKLITVDKVDFVVSGYATVPVAAAMPVVMKYGKVFPVLFPLGVNQRFNYDKYFNTLPTGPDPYVGWSKGYFEIAASVTPKPETVAMIGIDNEYGRNCVAGGRTNAEQVGLRIIFEEIYPPDTTDFTPLLRKVKSVNPDVVFVCSYPTDSVGIIKAAKEIDLRPKLFGGSLVGLQSPSIQAQLGPTLEGVVTYHTWVPEPTVNFPGINDFLKRYQERAKEAGVDPLGYYLPPFAYAMMQILEKGIEGCKCFDDNKIAEWLHSNEIDTIVGKIRFAPNGEWSEPRLFYFQFQNIKGSSIDAFAGPGVMKIIWPKEFKSGDLIYPFPGWK